MARTITFLFLICCTFFSPLKAEDVWIPIVGTVNQFRTDVRIFNPSFDNPLTISAYLLPLGSATSNPDNRGVQPVSITIQPRVMRVYDDVVQSMFNTSGLGAIRLVAANRDFEATARIYAVTSAGTLGQFEIAGDAGAGLTKGVLLQLKSFGTAPAGFRTNIGAANPNASPNKVRYRLHNRNNQQVGPVLERELAPYGAFPSTEIRGFFGTTDAANADLTDAWVSFDSDLPVFVYGSVIDNATTDPTFVPALPDSGVRPVQSAVKVFNITARQWQFDVEQGAVNVKVGDRVKLRLTSVDVAHGFTMPPYIGNINLNPNQTVESQEFVVTQAGQVTYACTNTACGVGHNDMTGIMTVTP